MNSRLLILALAVAAAGSVHAAEPAPAATGDTAPRAVATLGAQTGVVLVNKDVEFVTAAEGQVLFAGERVMVMEGGAAEIVFVDGCRLPLGSGSMVSVPATSTCAGAVARVESVSPSHARALGSEEEDDDRMGTMLQIGGTAAVMAWMLMDDDDAPVSP